MRPTDYMPDVRARLDAARNYIMDFQAKSQAFFNTRPYEIVAEEESKGSNKVLRYRFVVLRELPADLRPPITACIHELRSILDNLVWGLSQVAGEPSSCGIAFPVFITEHPTGPKDRFFDAWAEKNQAILSRFPTGASHLIRQLQPFNPDKRGNVGTNHIIYVLNRLANQDKHKMLLHVAGVHRHNLIIRRLTAGPNSRIGTGRTLEHNSIIMEVTMPASQAAHDVQVKLATHIAFDKSGPTFGAPVRVFLVEAYNFIREEVVAKFEPFFPA